MYSIAERVNLHASLRIRKLFMVVIQVLLVPRVLLKSFVIFNILEDDLAEAVKVCYVGHLRVEQLGHQITGCGLVVDLGPLESPVGGKENRISLTCVHLLIPYFTIRGLVMGADMLTM